MKADSGFQDNYSVVVASGTSSTLTSSHSPAVTTSPLTHTHSHTHTHRAFTTADARLIDDEPINDTKIASQKANSSIFFYFIFVVVDCFCRLYTFKQLKKTSEDKTEMS